MKVLLVHAHAEPKSFCSALYQTAAETLAAQGHSVRTSDLYAQGYNPVGDRADFEHEVDPGFFKYQREQVAATKAKTFAEDVRAEMEKLDWADTVIFTFPLWWFSVPGILKGWFDRTFAMGYAYGGGRWFETGPFRGKKVMLAFTAGAPPERYTEGAIFGGIERVLYPIHVGVFNLTGFDVLEPFIAWAPARIGQEARENILSQWRARLEGLADETPLPMHTVADHPDPVSEFSGRAKTVA